MYAQPAEHIAQVMAWGLSEGDVEAILSFGTSDSLAMRGCSIGVWGSGICEITQLHNIDQALRRWCAWCF